MSVLRKSVAGCFTDRTYQRLQYLYLEDRTVAIPTAYMGDSTQPQQKSAGAGENQEFGAIWAGPSQTATFMPFWIYNIQVCKHSDMKKHF